MIARFFACAALAAQVAAVQHEKKHSHGPTFNQENAVFNGEVTRAKEINNGNGVMQPDAPHDAGAAGNEADALSGGSAGG